MDFLKRVFGGAEPNRPAPATPLEAFDQAKALASELHSRQVALLRPDLSLLALACPDAASLSPSVLQMAEDILPSTVKRKIAVVADTSFAPAGSRAELGSPAWTSVGNDLPFFGILTGLGCIGHTVWIFDVTVDMAIACRDADVLIIDGGVAERVPESSMDAARGVMRTGNIFVHDRQSFQLRPLSPPGLAAGKWDAVFEQARTHTMKGDRPQIVLVRPDRLVLLPCIPRQAMTPGHVAQALRIIPAGAPRNVVAIASTELAEDASDSQVAPAVAQLRAAGRAIPFFGLLLNLASVGNPTWIFDANPEAIVPGCRNADLLFIDSALANKIPAKAVDDAAAAMRSANIAVYDRASKKIGFLRSLGGASEPIVFRD